MFNVMSFSPWNFSRYAPQTEYSTDDANGINERMQTQQKSTINNIPSLMSLPITPPITTTNTQQKPTISTSVIKENIEPLPFPQHGPGPIQRPNKLSCLSTIQASQTLSFPTDSTQTPNTPDVLDQINHLLDHQNSTTIIPSNVPNLINSSTTFNDISTPHVPWTPFSTAEWSSKYDSSWPGTNIQSSAPIQNPFAQRQILRDEPLVWPMALGTTTPSSSVHPQRTSEWNELFSSNASSSNETTKSMNNSWLKFLPVPDSPLSSRQENDRNNPFWNPFNLNETQQNSSTSWWQKMSSDDNNNNNNNNNNDQSRWDFAR